jgi:hypothetical protein
LELKLGRIILQNSGLPAVFKLYVYTIRHAVSLVHLLWLVYCTPADADIAHTEVRMEERNGQKPYSPNSDSVYCDTTSEKADKKKFSPVTCLSGLSLNAVPKGPKR